MPANAARLFSGLVMLTGIAMTTSAAQPLDRESARSDPDGDLLWYDATLLGIEGKGWADTESGYDRFPARAREAVRPPVWSLSRCSAGLHVRFSTTAHVLQVRWTLTGEALSMPHMPATGVSGIDLYAVDASGRTRFQANGRPTAAENTVSLALSGSPEYVLYLPLYNGVKLLELGIPGGEALSKLPPRPISQAVVFYGTSITQGGCASRPGLAATSIVGRRLGVPVINLGFSGNGTMDLEVAELLTELDPAVYVLDCLANMSPELLSERAQPFIRRLRSARPDTPILLAEDSSIADRPTRKGDILRRLHTELTAAGDTNLYLLPNAGMLGDDREGTVDGCHPNDLGMYRLAQAFAPCLKRILDLAPAP